MPCSRVHSALDVHWTHSICSGRCELNVQCLSPAAAAAAAAVVVDESGAVAEDSYGRLVVA